MKIKLCIGVVLFAVATAWAQTNNLTTLLQQGLFEEQANRNLDAAIENYAVLARQFDKDRQIAATAVFRLGECCRAQGKTNEAAVQYQRILKDFADQQTLATLSRQNLAGMGIGQPTSRGVTANGAPEAASEILRLSSQITAIEELKGDPEKQARTVQAVFPDEDLKRMLLHLPKLQAQETMFKGKLPEKIDGIIVAVPPSGRVDLLATGFPPSQASFGLKDAKAELQKQLQFISERVNFILGLQKERLQFLQSLASGGASGGASQAHMTAVMDEEDQEIARIKQMIQNSPDLINARENKVGGQTPLVKAATQGWVRVVQYLLDNGAQMDNAALLAATSAGHKSVVELLLDRGANVNWRDLNDSTPLHVAAQKGYVSLAELLIKRGADPNARNRRNDEGTPLLFAIRSGQTAMTTLLLAKGADVNAADKLGLTPLAQAAQNGSLQTLNLLIKAGAKLDAENKAGRTALALAAQNGGVDCVKAMLAAKANPNAGKDNSALRNAISYPEIVKLLLDAGANPNADKDRSILFQAMEKPEPESLKLLLSAGADPNAKGAPLVNAIYAGQEESAALLVQYGADVNAPGLNGMTPLMMAVWRQNLPILSMLLTNKVDINVRHSSGRTALDMSKYAEGGSNPSNPGNYGRTFNSSDRDLARKISEMLRQHGALDNLPEWDRIAVNRPGWSDAQTIFYKGTNDWNHFTLLELIYQAWWSYRDNLNYPDLANVVIVRPAADGTEFRRMTVNLLDATNRLDCSRDVPLEFGDVVEISEREHSLAEKAVYLSSEQKNAIEEYFRSQKPEASLIVGKEAAIKVPLIPFASTMPTVLSRPPALNALTSNCDLSQVKVTRKNPKTQKSESWVLDCRNQNDQSRPYFWLRNGDVIEVPLKK